MQGVFRVSVVFLALLLVFLGNAPSAEPATNANVAAAPRTSPTRPEISEADAARNWRFFDACYHDDGAACVALGRLYQEGDTVQKTEERAFQFFARACEKQNATGCRAAADVSNSGAVSTIHPIWAERFYDSACRLGDYESCTLAASKLLQYGDRANKERAEGLFRIGCINNIAANCREYAKLIVELRATSNSDVLGARLLRRACNMDDKASCDLYRNYRRRDDNSRCTLPNATPAARIPFNVEAAYPETAIQAEIEGRVDSNVYVNSAGEVTKIDIENSQPEGIFDDSVRNEAMKMKFFPATNCSINVAGIYHLRVEFKLD